MNLSPKLPPSPSPPPNGNPNSIDQYANTNPTAAPGFRFHPTEEELISTYLNRKVSNLQLPFDAIAEVDLYKHDPWDLPSLSRLRSRDREWFFFTLVDRKYGGSHRANRATPAGYWKSSGRDREVRCREKVVGMKKCLIFHVGRCPNGRRTDWLMHEYRRLEEDEKKASDTQSSEIEYEKEKLGFVLGVGLFFNLRCPCIMCRTYIVFNKSAFGQQKWDHYGAPFVEHEWEEEEDENDDEEAMMVAQDLTLCKETMQDKLIAEDGERCYAHSDDIDQGTTEMMCNIDQSIGESSFSKLNLPSEGGLVPGFRFHPTDEELIAYYLKRKVSGLPLRGDAISEVNLYKWAPWDLPHLSRLSLQTHNTEWYFFTIVDRKQGPNRCSLHANRITPEGYWKSTGNDCPVRSLAAAKVIGMKKCLIFHKGRSPHGQRTNWVMHEYRLELAEDEQNPLTSLPVVCRVYQKSGYGPRKKRARYAVHFSEEEQEESAQDMVMMREAQVSSTEAQSLTSGIFRESEVPTKEAEHLGKELKAPTKEALFATEQDHVKASNDIQQVTKKKNQKIYSTGSQVEVAYIRGKLPIAWYTATVMDIENERILSVEYLSLRNDDGTLLSEIVSTQYVRPRSPSTLEIRHFELLDEVEAFYNGGWWPGVVARVNKGLKYNVKFMHLEEEIEFSNKELRLLYDWVDGQWIQSSQDKFMESQNLGRSESAGHVQLSDASNSTSKCKVSDPITPSTNNANETTREFPISSINNVSESPGGPLLQSNVNGASCIIPISSTNDVNENSDRSLSTSMMNETPCIVPTSFTDDVSENSDRSPLIGNVNETPSAIPISSTNDVNESVDRHPLTNHVSETPCIIPNSSTKYVDENSDRSPLTNYVSEEAPCEYQISSMNNGNRNLDMCPSTNDANEASCEYPVSSTNTVNEASREFPISSTNNVNKNSERGPPTKDVSEAPCEIPISATNYINENLERSLSINRAIEASHEFPPSFTNNGNDNSNSSTFQSQLEDLQPCKKAKKGATEDNTRLLDSRCAETSSAVRIGFDVRTPIIEELPNFRIKTLVEKFCSSGSFKNINLVTAGSIVNPPSNILLGKFNNEPTIPDRFTQEFIPELDHQGEKELRKHTIVEKRRKNFRPQKLKIIEPSLEGDSSMGNHRENEAMEPPVERLHQTQCGTCSDNGSEARALFNVNSSSSDANLIETSTSSVQPSENRTEAQNEVLSTKATVKKGRPDKSPAERLPLPFGKCSSIWDSIESMEVFTLMPQRPHFLPLEQYCREFREGMAIGLMVTFSNLVNNIDKLDMADSRQKFDGIMKTLVHLEGHGFDVQRIRAHLMDMLRAKDKQERLLNEKATLKSKLAKRRREKDKINVVIESIENASRGLELSLSHLYTGKSSILERKRENDSRLDRLEVDSRRLDDALLSAERDFEATRSAKW